MEKGMFVRNMSFKAGQTMTFVGIAKPEASNFAINIGTGEDEIAMHMNPRFNAHGDQNRVVYNSYKNEKWGDEFRGEGFPFKQGEEYKIAVRFNKNEFEVTLPDGSVTRFANRLGLEKYICTNFDGDARITYFEIK